MIKRRKKKHHRDKESVARRVLQSAHVRLYGYNFQFMVGEMSQKKKQHNKK